MRRCVFVRLTNSDEGPGQFQERCMPVRRIFALAFWLVICSFFALSPGHTQISIGISVDVEPPPLPVYDQPPIPAPGYLWVPGYWAWDDDTGYYWVPGTWVTPPEPGLLWTPGYWGWDDGSYQFHDGYWGPQIGFYGGVAYGFGYTGDGYEGGYWRNGNFFYNQSVNNISNVSITNVYNKTVVVNNASNVSYNGGTGGTAAKPTAEQMAAGKEHHVAATPEQTRHVEAAAKDPALSLNLNHGHPTVAATAHPALFTGPGIIRARPGKPIAAVTPEGHRKAAPSNPAALPGNKVVPGSAPAGPGNAAISPGNKPGSEMHEHKGNAGGAATPGAGNTVSPGIKEHKGSANGGPSPGAGSATQTKLPTNAVHAPARQIALPSPPPPPRAAAPPPPPRAAAPPPAPRVAAPAAKPKCQPGQHC
jgi:YXWGXW repeat-containing protein